ncbi:MAG TPA: NAD(P)-dependent oxidoreductase [Verrucomicrobiales bacterium]|nr:NAD(P)-dependent oxidoreductase [Verrucomicrobiales bacterium]
MITPPCSTMNPPVQQRPGLGIIGMGLMGGALMRMTGAARGWDIDPARCVHADSAAEVFANCAVVMLCLPDSHIASAVLAAAETRPGQIIVDTTTGDPGVMAALGAALAEKGCHYLDATISGSSVQLLRRDVLVMAGGDADVVERCREIFDTFASEVIHAGPCGAGARMKLVTNLVLGLNRAALAEGLAFAEALGVEPESALRAMRAGNAYSRAMDVKGEKMIRRDYTPQARLSQHLKDLRLMQNCAGERGMDLPLARTHRALLEKAEGMGLGSLDNSAILEVLRLHRE